MSPASDAESILIDGLQYYPDLLANVRRDGRYHSIKRLVQPNDPEVMEVARVLAQARDFLEASWEFVDSFTTYEHEVEEYWRTPAESLRDQVLDCDCKAILLASILRNCMSPEEVYCAVGMANREGHMWILTRNGSGQDRIIEATSHPSRTPRGRYVIHALFNDKFAFATPVGLKEFGLIPAEESVLSLGR